MQLSQYGVSCSIEHTKPRWSRFVLNERGRRSRWAIPKFRNREFRHYRILRQSFASFALWPDKCSASVVSHYLPTGRTSNYNEIARENVWGQPDTRHGCSIDPCNVRRSTRVRHLFVCHTLGNRTKTVDSSSNVWTHI